MAGRNKIAKRKGAAKISPMVLFLIWGGLLIGVVAVLILLQNGSLNRQLTAGLPSGSPSTGSTSTASVGACYSEMGCVTTTRKKCDSLRGGPRHAFYWIGGKKCLERYSFRAKVNWGESCWWSSRLEELKQECTNELEASVLDELKTMPGWGLVSVIVSYADRHRDPWSISYFCDVTCAALTAPQESPAPEPEKKVYVSVGNAGDVSEGGGLGKAYFTLRVHDINGNNESSHGELTVNYHTKGVEIGEIEFLAKEGVDYEKASSSVTIPDGSSTGVIKVTIFEDNEPEDAESFWIELDSVTGGQLGWQYGIATIIDDDSETSVTPSP